MKAVVMKMARVVSSVGRSFEKTWRGLLVAALAFACGVGLVYSLRRAPRAAKPATSPAVSAPPCETAAPPTPVVVAAPTYDDEEEEYGTPELQKWKNLHNGAPLPLECYFMPTGSMLPDSKVVVLSSGRTLAAVDNVLYMTGADRHVVWKFIATQQVIDFAYVRATGLVYVTAGDNNFFILDAATGRELYSNSRNGAAGYGAVIPYGEEACLVVDEFSGYREGYAGGYEPMQDGVTAWRGTRMLWRVPVPPDAELQVVGSKIYAVTKTKTRILVREIEVPKR